MANLLAEKLNYIFLRRSIVPLLVLVLLTAGCSDQRANTREAHPPDYFDDHAAEATADVNSCRICHGIDFAGNGDAVSCFDCHVEGPPFGIHPADWTDVLVDHELFAETLSWTSCAASSCHGGDLRGGLTGSSCFETAGCHPGGGEPPAPHVLPHADAADHGPAAKANQFYCRNCHGRPQNIFDGGFVADPAILNKPLGDCSDAACHPDAEAHPTNWEGTNDPDPVYPSTHRDITEDTEKISCALCHKTTGPGSGPFPGAPSCFSANFTNANGVTSGCHPAGVRAPHEVPYTAAALHGPAARNNLAYCQECHGIPGTIAFDGGFASPGCSDDPACHPDARAHPTNWEGGNDPTPDYRSSHRNAGNQINACPICHDYTRNRPAPDPDAVGASCFAANFTNADGSTNGCHSDGPGGGDDD